MARLTKEALLGASDLVEREVELPSIGGSVLVRSLPAAYSNQASSEALEVVTGRRGEQTARVNTQKLEALQVLHALVDPQLSSLEEAMAFQQKVGPAWRKIVDCIDEISGIDKQAIEDANTRFRPGGSGEAGEDVGVRNGSGDGGPDLSVRTGSGVADAGGGAG